MSWQKSSRIQEADEATTPSNKLGSLQFLPSTWYILPIVSFLKMAAIQQPLEGGVYMPLISDDLDSEPPTYVPLADTTARIRRDHENEEDQSFTEDPGTSEALQCAAPETQAGIKNIEAAALLWTGRTLFAAYAIIWLTYFVESMLSGTTSTLAPYVTSDFGSHSMTPAIGILSSVVGGVTNLSLAKVLDIFGRPQGYLFCIVLATMGLSLMATCNSVELYAVAAVFQTVGNNGILYSLTVLVADTSSLRSRGLIQAVVSSPNLIACWLAGPLSSWFLEGPGWRWAFGTFTILVPSITLPLLCLLCTKSRQAGRLGLPIREDVQHHRTATAALAYYCQQFDVVGLALLSLGAGLFLLPFNLYAQGGWSRPLLGGMLLVGSILFAAFFIWEKKYASLTFIPYSVLLDRTVLGACGLSATLFFSFWCWNSFFSSYLQVVNGLTVIHASYVVQTYTMFSVLCGIAVGALIHQTGRFKPVCLYVGVPLSIIGTGLMAWLSNSRADLVPIVLCQVAISAAAGIVMVCDEIAILAAASQQHTAVCLAVLGLFGNIGGALGLTVASALWQAVFPRKLKEYLPPEDLPRLEKIYANISVQLSFPAGSKTLTAIQHAYGDSQMRLLFIGTLAWVAGFIGVLFWRNINVIGIKQAKGST